MARKLEVKLIGDERNLLRSLGRSGAAVNKFGDQSTRLHARVTKSFGGMAVSMAKFGAASAGIAGAGLAIGKITQETVGFDKAMRNVNSIAQLSEKRFGSLEKQVRGLAGKTAQAPETLAEGLYDLVSSGFNASQSMTILGSSAKAATAGLTTTEVSTKAVASVLNAYHKPASAAAKISDTLFQTVNLGVISFEKLSDSIGDVLPFASQLGVGLDQVGASVATMTKAGISPEETMTRLKNTLVAFIKPSEDMSKAIKATGAESGEALVKQKGFQGALEAVVKTTDGSKKSLATLFPNIRALGGALALTGINAHGAEKDLRGFKNVSGATNKALRQQSQSVAYGWQQIKAKISATSIAVGSVLILAVNKGLGGLETLGTKAAGAVGGVIDEFKTLKDGTPAKDQGLMKRILGPDFKPEKAKGTFGAIGTMIADSIKEIDWQGIGDTMGAGLSTAFNASGKLPSLISQGLSQAFAQVNGEQVLGKLVDVLGQAVDALFSPRFWIKHFAGIFATVTLVIPVARILKIPGASFLFRFISKPFFAAVKMVGTGLLKVFGQAGSHAITAFLSEMEKVAPRTARALLSVVTISGRSLRNIPSILARPFRSAGSAVVSAVNNLAGRVGASAGKIVSALLRPILNAGARAGSAILRPIKAMVSAVHSWGARFFELGANLVKSLARGVVTGAKAAVDAVGDVGKSVVKKAKDVFKIGSPSKEFTQIGEWISQGLAEGIASGKGTVDAAVRSGLLFPLDAAIATLNAQKERLQASFEKWDARRNRRELVRGISDARISDSAESIDAMTSAAGSGSSRVRSRSGNVVQWLSGLARSAGLTVTSTTGGKHAPGSNHYKGLAIDAAGAPAKMAAFFDSILKRFGPKIKELFYDPKGGIKNGQKIGAIGGHGDHVHVAMDSVLAAVGKGMGAAGAKATGKLTANQIRGLAYAAGFRGHDLDVAVAVAMAESGGKVKAQNKNRNGTTDRGLFQINSIHGAGSTFDVNKNTAAAYSLYKRRGGFKDWVAYNSGSYKQYMGKTGSGKGSLSGLSGMVKGGDGSSIADAIKGLKDFDRETARTKKLAAIDIKIKGLEALRAYKDTIGDLGDSLKDLASQGASAWRTMREGQIDASSGNAELAALQAQDAKEQHDRSERDLKKAVADAQFLADHSGGQTHVDALQQLADAKQDLDAFYRKDREDKITADLQAQKDGLDQEETNYRNSLQTQFATLLGNLDKRKISYREFVSQVNAIMAPLGGEFKGSAEQEAAVNAVRNGIFTSAQANKFGVALAKGWGIEYSNGTASRFITPAEMKQLGYRAKGGPVTGGDPYVVGERGPELFVPRRSGMIVPNDKIGSRAGGGGDVHVHGDMVIKNTRDADRFARRLARQLAY